MDDLGGKPTIFWKYPSVSWIDFAFLGFFRLSIGSQYDSPYLDLSDSMLHRFVDVVHIVIQTELESPEIEARQLQALQHSGSRQKKMEIPTVKIPPIP